jgi:hypothetical protein
MQWIMNTGTSSGMKFSLRSQALIVLAVLGGHVSASGAAPGAEPKKIPFGEFHASSVEHSEWGQPYDYLAARYRNPTTEIAIRRYGHHSTACLSNSANLLS